MNIAPAGEYYKSIAIAAQATDAIYSSPARHRRRHYECCSIGEAAPRAPSRVNRVVIKFWGEVHSSFRVWSANLRFIGSK